MKSGIIIVSLVIVRPMTMTRLDNSEEAYWNGSFALSHPELMK